MVSSLISGVLCAGERQNRMDFDKETAMAPIHHHEEYEEHDWCLNDYDDEIDTSLGGDIHMGPMCKRCNYWFCIYCEPDGWDKRPCVVDYSTCPKCGKRLKISNYCPNCGQKIDWSF